MTPVPNKPALMAASKLPIIAPLFRTPLRAFAFPCEGDEGAGRSLAAECELSLPGLDSVPMQYVGQAIEQVAA